MVLRFTTDWGQCQGPPIDVFGGLPDYPLTASSLSILKRQMSMMYARSGSMMFNELCQIQLVEAMSMRYARSGSMRFNEVCQIQLDEVCHHEEMCARFSSMRYAKSSSLKYARSSLMRYIWISSLFSKLLFSPRYILDSRPTYPIFLAWGTFPKVCF